MKHIKKRSISLLLVLVMIVSVFAFDVPEAKAASKPNLGAEKRVVFYSKNGEYGISVKDLGNGKVSNWKSSNSKVLKITQKTEDCVWFVTKKTGTSTISCTVKKGGKTYKLKSKVTVKKCDPFSYVKIDGKNVYKKNYYLANVNKKVGSKVKVEWKLKSGWKVRSAQYRVQSESGNELKTLKNKKKVPVGTHGTWVILELINSKNELYTYDVFIADK